MADFLKISRGGAFLKNFRPGGYTKNTPYLLFPMSAIIIHAIFKSSHHLIFIYFILEKT